MAQDHVCRGASGWRRVRRDREEEAVCVVVRVFILPDDLSRRIDAGCNRAVGAQGIVESRIGPVAIEEAVQAVVEMAHDLARIVHAQCNGIADGQGIVEGDVLETSEKEAMDAAGGLVNANDLLRGIDAACKGVLGSRIGDIEVGRGDATIRVVQEAVVAAAIAVKPDDLACIVDAECSRVGGGEGIVESRVAPVVIEEAVHAAGVAVTPDDLARSVDAKRLCVVVGRGIIEGGVRIDWHDTGSSLIVSLPENVGREAGSISNLTRPELHQLTRANRSGPLDMSAVAMMSLPTAIGPRRASIRHAQLHYSSQNEKLANL